MATLQAMVYL